MGRVNQTIAGALITIAPIGEKENSFEKFLAVDKTFKKSKTLSKLVTEYKKLYSENKNAINKMTKMEEVIIQMRTFDNINHPEVVKSIRLSIVQPYIYARCPFRRLDKEAQEVRAMVCHINEFGSDVEKLYVNDEFMTLAKERLKFMMEQEIEKNVLILNSMK